jgi:hypothetical protein
LHPATGLQNNLICESQRLGDVGAQVVADQSQRQVDRGGDTGARPHLAVADVKRVGIHLQCRVVGLQFGRRGPVRGHPAPIQQPGGGDESARAHRRDPPTPAGGSSDDGDQALVSAGRPRTDTTRQRPAPPSRVRSPGYAFRSR